jgi:ketosteroid isomerase-like protein
MKYKHYAISCTLFLLVTAIAAIPDPKHELIQIEQEWNDAYTKHDFATVGQILSDDWVFVDADGNILNKKQYMETGAKVQVRSEKLTDIVPRVYGETAVVTTMWSGTYTFGGKQVTETIRYMDTFIKQSGTWKCVATQGTRVK